MSTLVIATTRSALAAGCAALRGAARLGLDTEWVRHRTYFARLGLIQVASEETVLLADPVVLSRDDLEPLRELLYSRDSTKVVHAGRQDMEVLVDLWGAPLGPVFDTQVAAAHLGMGRSRGHADLVQELLGITLVNNSTLSDWTRRPLTAAQIQYASDDVAHLSRLACRLGALLESQGLMAPCEAAMASLEDASTYEISAERLARLVRGAGQLAPESKLVLKALAAWRDSEARELDLPRRWVVRDEVLVTLARERPRTPEALRRIDGIPEAWRESAPEAVVAAMSVT